MDVITLKEETKDALAKMEEKKAENLRMLDNLEAKKKQNDKLTKESQVLEKKEEIMMN